MPGTGPSRPALIAAASVLAALIVAPAARAAPGDLFVTDAGAFGGGGGVISVSLPAGTQTAVASGGGFLDPAGILIQPDDSLIVSDFASFGTGTGSLIRVDPASGTQNVVSTGGSFVDPWGLAPAGDGAVYVADPNAFGGPGGVVRVDLATGTQSTISSGGSFVDPLGLAAGPGGLLYVVDQSAFGGGGGVISLDPATGTQKTVSSAGSFVDPVGLLVLASGQIVVADQNPFGTSRLIRVDPATGTQTLLSDAGSLTAPRGMAVGIDGRILVADQNAFGGTGGVIAVDPATGTQSTLASASNFSDPAGIAAVQNKPPTADFTASPQPGLSGEPITFDASRSSDPDGPLADYSWDLDGDGTFETDGGAAPTLTNTFAKAGNPRVSLRVTDSNGATADSSRTLTIYDVLPPVLGKALDLLPVSGKVFYSLPGATTFQELKDGEQVPVGSTVDATDGRVRVVATDGFKAAGSGLFYGGVFVLRQREVRFAPAEMVLADRVHPGAVGIARASRRRRKKLTTRRLWGVARANFRTRGRFASATVRGTQWVTTDLPTGTRIHVRRGSVAVRDFAQHKSIVLQAGKSYFAKRLPRR